jgi:hypothetical protein
MNIGQGFKKPDISSVRNVGNLGLSWTGTASGVLKPIKSQFNRRVLGIKKYPWAVFAVLLTAAIIEFNYYQARLTREYLRAFLVSAAQTNGEIDALDAKINQLNIKLDALSAKLDKLPLSSPAVQARPRRSIFSKPR